MKNIEWDAALLQGYIFTREECEKGLVDCGSTCFEFDYNSLEWVHKEN